MLEYIGPKGPKYLPLVGTLFVFILLGNLMGLVPGLMAPTSNINVTLGCALTTFVYYQFQGFREQGILGYLRHFAAPPGAPIWIAPIYLPIEIISQFSRILSLSVRLFGNIFGEELVILILFSIVPFVVPLPMMFLGIITATLQAFIFVMLTMIYLGGAVEAEPGVSRRALSRRVCEWLDWRAPNGRLQEMSCRKALLELDRRDLVELPACTRAYAFQRASPREPEGWPALAPVRGSLAEVGPVEVVVVSSRYGKVSRLWNALMERFHPLGRGPLCGEQIRNLVRGETAGPLGALSFSSATWRLAERASRDWSKGDAPMRRKA
jgi:ATP synthase subunit 6